MFRLRQCALICGVLLFGIPARLLRAQTQPLDVRMALSKTTVLLGEPVWVDVTLTNRSAEAIGVDWGTECCGATAISLQVPEAVQGNGEPKSCGGMACSCPSGGPAVLLPGASETRLYVLKGDFRLTHPGRYTVMISKSFPYAVDPLAQSVMLPKDHPTEMRSAHAMLQVMPPDPVLLLALEQSLAAEASEHYREAPFAADPNLRTEAYRAAVRAWSDANRAAQMEHSVRSYALYAGLAAYPASGMEPVFESWQTPPQQVGYGVTALYHLNTVAALARLVMLPNPNSETAGAAIAATRFGAADSLGRMGDRSYLPLLEQLTADENLSVRMLATLAVGRLGGAEAVPFLSRLAQTARSEQDRNDAVQALGFTASAEAVPLLIDLFSSPAVSTAPSYWLMVLTHHQISIAGRQLSAQEIQLAWRNWWGMHSDRAQIFGPDECFAAFDR
jgi:hypothetical protein